MNCFNLFFSKSIFFSSHAHTTNTLQPASSKDAIFSLSRQIVLSSFSFQKSSLAAGRFERGHPSWPCQKQPCTKIIFLYLGKTISGFPGRSRRCKRNLYPILWSNDLTISSGLVFLPFTADIIRLRLSLLKTSTSRIHFLEDNSRRTTSATRAAKSGGTALPICLAISILVPVNRKSSGKL